MEPLVYTVKDLQRLLQIGRTRSYELLASGELESFRQGHSRRTTPEFVKKYIEQLIRANDGEDTR